MRSTVKGLQCQHGRAVKDGIPGISTILDSHEPTLAFLLTTCFTTPDDNGLLPPPDCECTDWLRQDRRLQAGFNPRQRRMIAHFSGRA